MDEAYILTLDAGTTGVKCAAFSPKGEAACSAVEAYPTYYPFSGWAQQKPGEQLNAALRAIRIVLEKVPAEQVCALVFSGTMNGCIPIDEKGEALHENIIHSDLRAEPQTEQLLLELKRRGIDIPTDALTPEACAQLLRQRIARS